MAKSETDQLRAEIEQLRAATVAQYKAPNLRLRRVVEASGAPETAIRNWLTRRQFDLSAEKTRDKGETRMFSPRDIVIIALAWRMTAHGLPIGDRGGLLWDFVFDIDKMIASHQQNQDRVYMTWPSEVSGNYMFQSHSMSDPFDLSSIPSTCTIFQPLRIAWETLGRLGWETPLDEQQSKSPAEDADQGSDDA